MIHSEGNRNQPLQIDQGESVCLRRRWFRSHQVRDGCGPPTLVLLVIFSAAVDATPFYKFRSYTCRRVGETCSESFHRFRSGDRFFYCPQMRPLYPYFCYVCLLLPLRRHPCLSFHFACCWAVAGLFAWRPPYIECLQKRASRYLVPQTSPWAVRFWYMTWGKRWPVGSTRCL